MSWTPKEWIGVGIFTASCLVLVAGAAGATVTPVLEEMDRRKKYRAELNRHLREMERPWQTRLREADQAARRAIEAKRERESEAARREAWQEEKKYQDLTDLYFEQTGFAPPSAYDDEDY